MDPIYSFGVMSIAGEQTQTVRVKSEAPVDLAPGFHTIVEEYPEMTVTHDFKVKETLKEVEDGGYHYKWAALEWHSTAVDKSPAAMAKAEQTAANLDYLCMMSGIEIPTGEEGGMTNE